MVGNNGLENIEKTTDFTFSEHTTYCLGGSAECAYFPKTESELFTVYDSLEKGGKPFVILGNGSNVLASDSGFRGAVICTKKLTSITRSGGGVYALAGVNVSTLLKYCMQHSLGGVEYLAGIPATVGGLALMNGGAHSHTFSENIISVSFYDGNLRVLSAKNCNFGNKYSTMRDIKGVISGVLLNLHPQEAAVTRKKIKAVLRARSRQPKGKSCGCVFKNSDGFCAGKLIDGAGLKGVKIGGAEVSGKHANFILNNGASSSDIRRLIDFVKDEVYKKYDVRLEEEVVYIGDF